MNQPQGLVTAHLPVLDLLHQAVAETVECIGRIWLRHNVTARNGVTRLAHIGRGTERSATAAVRSRRKLPHFKSKRSLRFRHIIVWSTSWRHTVISSYDGCLEITGDHREGIYGVDNEAQRAG
ncbi:MAG: hypothetical protein DME68_04785 [Verrucomicrobia bacterium]|nr:MAG: hypothetical protein DME68_04785 [Verrucomicrobiota bacterium]